MEYLVIRWYSTAGFWALRMAKQLKVDSVVNLAGSGKPNFPVSPTYMEALHYLLFLTHIRLLPLNLAVQNGAIWWDSANSKVYVYANGEFKEITLNTDYPSAYTVIWMIVLDLVGYDLALIIMKYITDI